MLPGLTLAAEEGMASRSFSPTTTSTPVPRVRGLRMPPNRLVQIRIDEVEGDAMWGTLVGPPSCQP